MTILEQARDAFIKLCDQARLDPSSPITVRPLSPADAIGTAASCDFPISRGRELVIEALFQGARGQAFTDHPRAWHGTLGELLALPIAETSSRAVLVAAMNAVLRARGVAAGGAQQIPHRVGARGAGSAQAQPQEGPIGMVVDGEDLGRMAADVQVAGALDDAADDGAGASAVEIARGLLAATAAGHQVVEAGARDALVTDEVEEEIKIRAGVAGQGQAQAGAHPGGAAGAQASQRRGEGACLAPERVVPRRRAVEADADIRNPDFAQATGDLGGDEGAIGRDHRLEAGGAGAVHQVRQVGPQQRFATREEQHRDAEGGQIGRASCRERV